MDEQRLAGQDDRDAEDALLQPQPQQALAQGREQRPRAARSIGRRLRRGRAADQVAQVGAACHDGYYSCFYREYKPAEQTKFKVIGRKVFDPESVYG